jgi:hypothetical protein
VTLTSNFDIGLDHPVHGRYGWGSPTPRRRSNCQTKKLKFGYGPQCGPGTKTNWPTDRRSQCNLKLNLRYCTENYRPVLSSDRVPYMKNEESNFHSNKCNIWSLAPKGARHQDELADWQSVVMWLRLQPPMWGPQNHFQRWFCMVLALSSEEGDYAVRATRLSATQIYTVLWQGWTNVYRTDY